VPAHASGEDGIAALGAAGTGWAPAARAACEPVLPGRAGGVFEALDEA
jgi:hypothetical protein